MSLHPSLKIDKASSTQRTVMSRIERIKELMKKGLWTDASSVTALPKTKIVRIKAKKKAAEAAPAEGAAAAAPASGAAAAKPAAKPAAKK
jgi:small basic protein (TIGR04137 family)